MKSVTTFDLQYAHQKLVHKRRLGIFPPTILKRKKEKWHFQKQ